MKFVNWYPYYLQILYGLNLDIKKDILSSLLLSNLISNMPSNLHSNNLLKKLNNKKILIIGAGPSI